MTIEVALAVSILSVAFSIYFGIKNSKRTDTQDLTERVKENTRINMKLDMIQSSTQKIENEIAQMKEDNQRMNTKIIKLEESAKSAHKRIDELIIRITEMEVGEHERKN